MSGIAQTEFNAWATAVETALGAANSLDPTLNPSATRRNKEIYQALLKDFQDSWDDWAVNTRGAGAADRDNAEGDSRKATTDQTLFKRAKVDLVNP